MINGGVGMSQNIVEHKRTQGMIAGLIKRSKRELVEEARLVKAEELLTACVKMLDDLAKESGRMVEYGEEDPFRMGEWFSSHEKKIIKKARDFIAAKKGE